MVDSIILQQGPNYFFAKRLQHWRAMVAASAGYLVSSNVAPASTTESVTKNRLLAMALSGFDIIEPMDVFHPDTSNVLMTLLLLHDLHCPAPQHPHPLLLFSTTSVHNGTWSCAYQLRSIVEVIVVTQYLRQYLPHVSVATLIAFFALMHGRAASRL
jgi:hypothetical protein